MSDEYHFDAVVSELSMFEMKKFLEIVSRVNLLETRGIKSPTEAYSLFLSLVESINLIQRRHLTLVNMVDVDLINPYKLVKMKVMHTSFKELKYFEMSVKVAETYFSNVKKFYLIEDTSSDDAYQIEKTFELMHEIQRAKSVLNANMEELDSVFSNYTTTLVSELQLDQAGKLYEQTNNNTKQGHEVDEMYNMALGYVMASRQEDTTLRSVHDSRINIKW